MYRPGPFWTNVRSYTALVATGLTNLRVWGTDLTIGGLSTRQLPCPGFVCHGCPWATFVCPVGVSAYGTAIRELPALVIGVLFGVAVAFGRLVCGFACPFGWFQDLLYRIPFIKLPLPRVFRYGKYLALILLVTVGPYLVGFRPDGGYIALSQPQPNKEGGRLAVELTATNLGTVPLEGFDVEVRFEPKAGVEMADPYAETLSFPEVVIQPGQTHQLETLLIPNQLNDANLKVSSPQSIPELDYQLYFCRVCPNGALTAHLPSYFYGNIEGVSGVYDKARGSWMKVTVLVVFLVGCVLFSRPFCRGACPLGAFYGLMSRLSFARVTNDRSACVNCGLCNKACPVELDVKDEVGGPECIACGECIKTCPKGSLKRAYFL